MRPLSVILTKFSRAEIEEAADVCAMMASSCLSGDPDRIAVLNDAIASTCQLADLVRDALWSGVIIFDRYHRNYRAEWAEAEAKLRCELVDGVNL